jgi:hypothetical protein
MFQIRHQEWNPTIIIFEMNNVQANPPIFLVYD